MLKQFKCDQCDSAFTENSSLKRHINALHLNIKPFKCDHCYATFTQSSVLKGHMSRPIPKPAN